MIFSEPFARCKAQQDAEKTENAHHHSGAGAFSAAEQRRKPADISAALHQRFKESVYRKAAQKQADGNREELKGIAAGINPSL